jgi:hypothetical protein
MAQVDIPLWIMIFFVQIPFVHQVYCVVPTVSVQALILFAQILG